MATANDTIKQMIASGQMTQDQAHALFNQAGITVAPGGGRIDSYLAANPQVDMMLKGMLNGTSSTGSMPIGIEPIHQYERSALQSVGENPFDAGTALMNPQLAEFLSKASQYGEQANAATQQGMRGFDAAEMQQHMNPYQKQVESSSITRLNQQGEELKRAMIDSMSKRGSATMGDLYGAQQMGDISKEMVQSVGDIAARLNYQGWTDALAQIEAQRNRSLQGGQIYAGMMNPAINAGSTAQSATLAAQQAGLQGLTAQQMAGQRIQGFNQGVADITMGDYMGNLNFPNTLVSTALSNYPAVQGNVGYSGTTQPNTLAQLGAGLSTLGGNLGSSNPNWYGQLTGVVPTQSYGPNQPNALGRILL